MQQLPTLFLTSKSSSLDGQSHSLGAAIHSSGVAQSVTATNRSDSGVFSNTLQAHHMGSDSINQYYAALCLFGLPFGNGTALRSVKRSIFD
jgi:hypothetical protein